MLAQNDPLDTYPNSMILTITHPAIKMYQDMGHTSLNGHLRLLLGLVVVRMDSSDRVVHSEMRKPAD